MSEDFWDFLLISEETQRYGPPVMSCSETSSESPATEGVPGEEPQMNVEPTMTSVRSEGLKLDLVLLKDMVSGLTIDYQNISKNGE